MERTRYLALTVAAVLTPLLLAPGPCQKDDEALTGREATLAVKEAALASEAATLVTGSIEIATTFTMGDALEKAAEEIRSFVRSQLPCAEVTLINENKTVRIVYGAQPGDCTYRGHTYAGEHSISVASTAPGSVQVQHTWEDFNNGRVSVSGAADVTWSAAAKTRTVNHQLRWTRLSDGVWGEGAGHREQAALAGGFLEGIEVNGSRSWTGAEGSWRLDIDAVRARWVDPVPESGAYVLDTPFDKTLSLSFARVDEDTIAVTVASGGRDFTFNVTKLGAISD